MPRSKEAKRRPNGSGRIYKQNGVYYLQYRLADGKRKSITLHNECGEKIADLREAEKAAKLFLEPLHKINEIKSREDAQIFSSSTIRKNEDAIFLSVPDRGRTAHRMLGKNRDIS